MPKPLKIKSFLPHREVEICRRLREIRLSHQWKQPDLARELGIPRGRLANYEYARAPVKFHVGYNLCNRLNVSLWWIATSKGPKHPFTPIAPSLLKNINDKALFSTVYDNHLSALVEPRLKELAATAGVTVERLDENTLVVDRRWLGVSTAESHLENVIGLIRQFAEPLEDDEILQFAFALERLTFSRNPLKPSGKSQISVSGKDEVRLDKPPVLSDAPGVKQIRSLPQLLIELRKLTKDRGRKIALANDMHVTRQAVDQWLSGATKPTAEMTFELISWVKKQYKRTK